MSLKIIFFANNSFKIVVENRHKIKNLADSVLTVNDNKYRYGCYSSTISTSGSVLLGFCRETEVPVFLGFVAYLHGKTGMALIGQNTM